MSDSIPCGRRYVCGDSGHESGHQVRYAVCGDIEENLQTSTLIAGQKGYEEIRVTRPDMLLCDFCLGRQKGREEMSEYNVSIGVKDGRSEAAKEIYEEFDKVITTCVGDCKYDTRFESKFLDGEILGYRTSRLALQKIITEKFGVAK